MLLKLFVRHPHDLLDSPSRFSPVTFWLLAFGILGSATARAFSRDRSCGVGGQAHLVFESTQYSVHVIRRTLLHPLMGSCILRLQPVHPVGSRNKLIHVWVYRTDTVEMLFSRTGL